MFFSQVWKKAATADFLWRLALLSPNRYQPLCYWEEGYGEEAGGLRWPGLALLPSTSPHCVRCRDPDCVEFGGQGACLLSACPTNNQTWPLTRTVLIGFRKRASYSPFISMGQRSYISIKSSYSLSLCNRSPDREDVVTRQLEHRLYAGLYYQGAIGVWDNLSVRKMAK